MAHMMLYGQYHIAHAYSRNSSELFRSEDFVFLFFLKSFFFSDGSFPSQQSLCMLCWDRLPFSWFSKTMLKHYTWTFCGIKAVILISSNSAAVLSWSNISCVWVLEAGNAIINGDMKAWCNLGFAASLDSCRFEKGFIENDQTDFRWTSTETFGNRTVLLVFAKMWHKMYLNP